MLLYTLEFSLTFGWGGELQTKAAERARMEEREKEEASRIRRERRKEKREREKKEAQERAFLKEQELLREEALGIRKNRSKPNNYGQT